MHQAVLPRQRPRARTLLAVAIGALALAGGAFAAGPARAATPAPSAVTCSGHVDRGLDPSTPDQLDYLFACSGSIKSYTVLASAPIGGFSVDAQVFLHGADTLVEADSFFCEGLIPGDGFNCTGQALVGGDVKGSFETFDPVCSSEPDAPRRPRISVVIADWNGATAGPFRLRGPEPCPNPATPAARKHRRKHAPRRAA
jgi:hypothetical protein